MERRRLPLKAILLFLLSLSGPASAEVVRCDNCTSSSSKITAAKSKGPGTHYVYDLINAGVWKFDVARVCEGSGACLMEVTPTPTEPEVRNFVLELSAYYQVTGGTMKSHFTLRTDGTTAGNLSAFDAAGPGAPRDRLFTWMRSSTEVATFRNTLPAIGTAIHQIGVTIASVWNDSMGSTLITIEFTDGSRITVSWEVVNDTYSVVDGSAKDKYGNPIPVTMDQIDGTRFDYSGEGPNGPAQQRMRDYLSLWRVPVSNGVRWACVRISGDSWHCAPY